MAGGGGGRLSGEGPFQVCFGSVSGCWVGSGRGSGRGASVRDKSITRLAAAIASAQHAGDTPERWSKAYCNMQPWPEDSTNRSLFTHFGSCMMAIMITLPSMGK